MRSRSLAEILVDWRTAEAAYDPDHPDADLLIRAEMFRREYAEAMAAHDVEAHELGRAPHQLGDRAQAVERTGH
jgi:hypothetical protein